MISSVNARRVVLLGLVVLVLPGCGGGTPVEVKGTVTFNGKPVPNCRVCFFPDVDQYDPSVHGSGSGVTDQAGTFTIKFSDGTDGIKPGSYKVIFIAYVDNKGKSAPPDAKPSEYPGGLKNLFPEKYESPRTTPEQLKVPSSGLQKDFAITS